MKRNRFILYSLIVALGFLWTGSSYISHMYRLQLFFLPEQVDIIALRWNYLAQAGGLALYAVLLWRFPSVVSRRIFFACVMLLDAALILLALTAGHPSLVVWAGIAMNLLHGTVAAAYLTLLGAFVAPDLRGRAFGYAYAVGSLSTYLLSLVADGLLIKTNYAIVAYLLMVGVNVFAVGSGEDLPREEKDQEEGQSSVRGRATLLFPALVLMGLLSSVGSHYQFQAIADQSVSLEMSRAFYAIGLVSAGTATDKSRKMGAIFCFASLVFPFAQVVLRGQPSLVSFTWGLSYFILGFYAVYRAVGFVDMAAKRARYLPLAAFGLAAGRIGEALGTFFPETVLNHEVYGTLLVLGLFVPLTFLFFFFFPVMHGQESSAPRDADTVLRHFGNEHALTRREVEVLRHLLMDRSNGEISSALYISESTVKFHVKNILRKTGCSNRAEIAAQIRRSDSW